MSTKFYTTLILAFVACSHQQEALIGPPIITERAFTVSSSAGPKSKAEMQSTIFDAALTSLQRIADSENAILRKDEKGWSVADPNTDEDLNAVWGNEKYVFIAGDNGTLLRSSNDGASWKRLKSGANVDLDALWGTDGGVVYAVGARGTILRSSNKGESWERQNSGTKVNLHGIWGFSSKEIYAVGDDGTILGTHDSGKTWTQQESGVSAALLDIWGYTNEKLYVVGEKGTILYSVDQGKEWDQERSGVDFLLTSVRGYGKDNIYVAGIGGTILHQQSNGTWKAKAGIKASGYGLSDTSWSREENPLFSAMATSSDSLFAVGGGRLWTLSGRDMSQAALPIFTEESDLATDAAARQSFQGVWASQKGKIVVVGFQKHKRLTNKVQEAIDMGDWSNAAFYLESVRDSYPERYELSAAYSLALLLAADEAATYLAKKTIMTFPKPKGGALTETDEMAAILWFFIGEAQTKRGSPKLAQNSYLISQWIMPTSMAEQRISKGTCVANIDEKAVKAAPYQDWSALYEAIHKSDKKELSSFPTTEEKAKKALCAQEPSGCSGDGPWLLKTTRRSVAGKEEAMLSLAFSGSGDKLFALVDIYHSPLDYSGIGSVLLNSKLVVFKDGLAWLSLEGPTFDGRGSEQVDFIQEERFFDTKSKKQVFSLSQKALVQSYGKDSEVDREFMLPVEGKLDGKWLRIWGGGCDSKIKL